MTKVIDRNGKATVYEYDAAGNRSAVCYPNGDVVTYTYDRENRLIKETNVMPCFPRALPTQIASRSELSCDLLYVQQGNSVTVESYTHDYEGKRTSKTVNENDTVFYVNDTSGNLSMVAAETDSEGNERAYFTRGDELLSMEKDGEICYYHYDGHGNVRF